MDFAIIKQAGLTQAEFAKLVKVTRVTVNLWVRGKMFPHKKMGDRVTKMLDMLREAKSINLLPLTCSRNKALRMAALETILQFHGDA